MNDADGILERVSGVADELKLANLHPQIAACRKLFAASGSGGIDVAVVGRFKAGKSSFLNHLANRNILPVGVVPLTAIVTRLRSGPLERAEIQFLNGEKKYIPFDQIRLYVGEDQNPNNKKQVAAVEVELPSLQLFGRLQFVDTPGLGSAFAHNTKATYEWLPNIGAVLVAISSDAPLSERDLELLEELRRHTPKIVLLLTKADLLSEPQRNEVLHFIREQLLQKWKTELPIFFYSIHSQESELKKELEQKLLLPLAENCDAAANQIVRHKTLALVGQTLNYLRIALAAATQAETARQALREKLGEERRQFDLLRSELSVLSRDWSTNALEFFLAQLQPMQRALQEEITTQLAAQFPKWHLRLPPLLDAWREWLNEFLKANLSNVSSTRMKMFCEPLRNAQTHLTRTLRAFHDRLAEHVKSALDVALTPREFLVEMREPTAPPVRVSYAFDASFSTIGWLIPLAIFRKPIEQKLLRKARYEVEKNLSRLAADWRERIARAIDEITREAEQEAREELVALEQMLTQRASKAPELRKAIQDLEQFERRPCSPDNSSMIPMAASAS